MIALHAVMKPVRAGAVAATTAARSAPVRRVAAAVAVLPVRRAAAAVAEVPAAAEVVVRAAAIKICLNPAFRSL